MYELEIDKLQLRLASANSIRYLVTTLVQGRRQLLGVVLSLAKEFWNGSKNLSGDR